METRRLQKTGGTTLIVSLPKLWATAAGLAQGSEVRLLAQANGTLVVDPRLSVRACVRRQEVPAGDADDHLFRRLVGAYLAGAREIEVTSSSRLSLAERKVVREFSASVIGLEIIEEEAERVLLYDVTDAGSLSLRTAVKRLYRIIRAMFNDCLQILDGQAELAPDVADRDREADKLYWFVNRQLHLMLDDLQLAATIADSLGEGVFYSHVARALERIGDHACRLALTATALAGGDDGVGLAERAREALAILEEAMAGFLNIKAGRANQTIDRGKRFGERCQWWLAQRFDAGPAEPLALSTALESVQRVALYATDIAEVTLNFAAQQAA